MALNIFLSYASEDQSLATAISDQLWEAFRGMIVLKSMSQFPLGTNYRDQIDNSLDEADILLVIATGHEKLTHTFTGYEVGFFRKSQKTRPYISKRERLERGIIPIAILAEIPDTLSDIQGIGITASDRFFFELDSQGRFKRDRKDPIYELFLRIDGILNKMSPVEQSTENVERQEAMRKEYKEQAESFYLKLAQLISTMSLQSEFPKTLITLRLPSDCTSWNFELDDRVTISCNGPTQGIFERSQSDQGVPWPVFFQRIGTDDIALMWNDALRSLVASSLAGAFAGSDQVVFSFDASRLFRLFVSQSTLFFDRSRELKIYVIESLRPEDIGDPLTTLLGKAIAIALRFRSLFLESNSPYGPNFVRLSDAKDWKQLIRKLMRELRVLLMQSREANLGDKRFIVALYGTDQSAIENIQNLMQTWSAKKDKLYQAATAALSETENEEAARDAFIGVLDDFCVWTREVNSEYMTRVIEKLKGTLEQSGHHSTVVSKPSRASTRATLATGTRERSERSRGMAEG